MLRVGIRVVDWTGRETYESDVRGYFPCCPICGSKKIAVNLIPDGRDTLSCEGCGARWHLYIGLSGLKWAELDVEADNGKGTELLGRKLDKNEWRKLSQIVRNKPNAQTIRNTKAESVKEKEIVREKEVIVKIRCPYCHNVYDETLDKCPHCGAKR
jgi:hypothetical protein